MTSPLRRWVDVLNQLALQGKDYPADLNHINERDTIIKRYNREIFFLGELEFQSHPLPAVVLTSDKL